MPKVEGYDDVERVLSVAEGSEIMIGIPSRNSAHTVNYVIRMAYEGSRKYLGGKRASIVVCDGLSSDGTVDVVKAFRNHLNTPILVIPNMVSRGKGGAVKTLIEMAYGVGAEALILVDSDLRSITPEWVYLLWKGATECGFTTPAYRRHKFDATITNFLARPMTAMAYGLDIKQPIGGDFGLGADLIRELAVTPLWDLNPWIKLFGVDIFLTHTALIRGLRPCEALLKAKIHDSKSPVKNLEGMFEEVSGTLFSLLIEYMDHWVGRKFKEVRDPETVEGPEVPESYPIEIRLDPREVSEAFIAGTKKYAEMYEEILCPSILKKLQEALSEGLQREVWVDIVLSFFMHFCRQKSLIKRTRLLKGLYYLWLGRFLRYYKEVSGVGEIGANELLRGEVNAFSLERSEFIRAVRSCY